MQTISTTTSEILLAEAIKSRDPIAFLTGVILSYEKTGTNIQNLIRHLKKDQTINHQEIEDFVNKIKKERKKYPQEE